MKSGRASERKFLIGLARAFGGAVFFSLPLFMTMEMWWLGFYMDRTRLALLTILMVPVLVVLDYFAGFMETSGWLEDLVDGLVAYGVGVITSIVMLTLFGVISPWTDLAGVVGMVSILAVPASFGAVIATSQLGGGEDQESGDDARTDVSYRGTIALMAAGSLFLGFQVAATEEMVLISYMMTPFQGVAAVILSLLMMHSFVYSVEFHGSPSVHAAIPRWHLFVGYTLVGYALALAVSAYVLWTFGRFEDQSLLTGLMSTVVLGVPASLGAAAARLIF